MIECFRTVNKVARALISAHLSSRPLDTCAKGSVGPRGVFRRARVSSRGQNLKIIPAIFAGTIPGFVLKLPVLRWGWNAMRNPLAVGYRRLPLQKPSKE